MLKRKLVGLVLAPLVLFAGCTAAKTDFPDGQLVGLCFARGHGSMWGNQLYVELTPDSIIRLHVAIEGELIEKEALPLSASDYEAVCAAVEAMRGELSPVKEENWFTRLFSSCKADMLDGGEWRKLTLVWSTQNGEETVFYNWPESETANRLETLLETLAFAAVTE